MNKKAQNRAYLAQCKEDIQSAESSDDPRKLSVALANMGYALFLNNRREEGIEYFDQAEVLAGNEVSDVSVLAHGLGLRILAYQESKRLPHAFKTAGKMLFIAEEEENEAVKCDALSSQAHTLLESGEVSEAFTRFQKAKEIARKLGDDERLMGIHGAMANLSLSIPSLEKALEYYQQALSSAKKIEDKEAEMGYLGNIGSVLSWQGKHDQAVEAFQDVLPYYQEKDQDGRIVKILNKLVQSYNQLENNERVFQYAFAGLELLDEQENELVFEFLEPIILAYYREGKIQEAHNMISEAITLARSKGDLKREVEFLINLGESFVASEMPERALDIYREALDGSRELERTYYEAYLIGRIGFVNAELDDLDEAVERHLQSIEMAQENRLPELEGEQRSMLALTYEELGRLEKAIDQAERAVEIYELAELEDSAAKARQLLENLKTKIGS